MINIIKQLITDDNNKDWIRNVFTSGDRIWGDIIRDGISIGTFSWDSNGKSFGDAPNIIELHKDDFFVLFSEDKITAYYVVKDYGYSDLPCGLCGPVIVGIFGSKDEANNFSDKLNNKKLCNSGDMVYKQ